MTKDLSSLRHMCGDMELKEKIALCRIHLRKCPSQDVTMSNISCINFIQFWHYPIVLVSADPLAKIVKSKIRNPNGGFWILGAPTKNWAPIRMLSKCFHHWFLARGNFPEIGADLRKLRVFGIFGAGTWKSEAVFQLFASIKTEYAARVFKDIAPQPPMSLGFILIIG